MRYQKINIFSDDWCELVFDNKNKEYGAYVHRKLSNKRHLFALITASVLFLLAVSTPTILKTILPKQEERNVEITMLADLKMEDNKPKDEKIEDLPPPEPLKSSIQFTPPVIKADKEVNDEEELKTQEELTESKLTISTKDIKGTDEEHGKLIEEVDKNKGLVQEEETKPFLIVEQMPEFPGGTEEMVKYIQSNVKYPQLARETNIQGKVYVTFVVTKDGRISNVKVLRGIGGGCDDEAVRVIKSMPTWKPGKQNGIAVPVQFSIPVNFTLRS
ncbi:MAG: energy transducer TonB [Bacteroidales bacterium]|nr:energy transducer TonB [Bacteroidales bacterium]